MSFDQSNFGPIGGENMLAPAQWSYRSNVDTVSSISAAGYFDDKQYQLESGDMIYVQGSDGVAWKIVNVSVSGISLSDLGGTSKELFSQSEGTLSNGSSIDSDWIDMETVSKYQLSYIGSAALSLSIESRATDTGASELTTPAPYTGTFYLADLVPRQRWMRFILTNDTGGNVTGVNMAVKGIYGGLDGASVFPLEISPSQFSPASLTQSVLIGKDSGGNYQNMKINQAGTMVTEDFSVEVARGTQTGYTLWNKFGYDSSVSTSAFEAIWSPSSAFTRLASGETLDIVSTDANDTSGGTGVNSVVVYGVDENWVEQIEVVVMNGTTNVTTVNQWLGVNRIAVFLSGSNGSNIGTITATASTAATIQAEMPAGGAVTQQCIFFVPADTNFIAEWLWANAVKLSGGGGDPLINIKMTVYSDVNKTSQEVFRGNLDTVRGNFLDVSPRLPFPIGEKSVVCLEAKSDKASTEVTARFSGILIADA